MRSRAVYVKRGTRAISGDQLLRRLQAESNLIESCRPALLSELVRTLCMSTEAYSGCAGRKKYPAVRFRFS